MEIGNAPMAARRLDDDEKATINAVDSGNLNAARTIINEAGQLDDDEQADVTTNDTSPNGQGQRASRAERGCRRNSYPSQYAGYHRKPKRHDNVLRDINALDIPSDLRTSFFAATTTLDTYGRPQPAFEINRDGFTLLAMGFTGEKALKFKLAYIAEFKRLPEYPR